LCVRGNIGNGHARHYRNSKKLVFASTLLRSNTNADDDADCVIDGSSLPPSLPLPHPRVCCRCSHPPRCRWSCFPSCCCCCLPKCSPFSATSDQSTSDLTVDNRSKMATVAGILVQLILAAPVFCHFSVQDEAHPGRGSSGLGPNEFSEALKESFSDFQVLKIFHKPEEKIGIIRDLNGSKFSF